MRLLIKKQFYDAFHKILLFIALFFIILVGMIFYSGFMSAKNDIKESIHNYYLENNLADFRLETNTSLNNEDVDKFIAEFNLKAEKLERFIDPSGDDVLYTRLKGFDINKVTLKEGRFPENNKEILLDLDYANSNNYLIDNYFIINNKAYKIVGLAKFVDRIFVGNYFPAKFENFTALKLVDNLESYNQLYIDSDISYDLLNEYVINNFSDDVKLSIVSKDYTYLRVENDIDMLNAILFIFPSACFISILIILFINYNRIIDEQKSYIGTLKANGFSLYKIFISLMIIPLLLVLISSIIGAIIGIYTVPKIYVNIINQFYSLPNITTTSIFSSIVAPVIILLISTIITISIPIILTIKKTPAQLMRTVSESNFGRTFLRKIKLPLHFKLVVRNIITSKRKNICLIIASSLLLGIVLAVFAVKDSVNYNENVIVKDSFNGDYVLRLDNMDDFIENKASDLIKDSYFYYPMTVKVDVLDNYESIIVYDETKPCVNLKDENNNVVNYSENGLFVPISLKEYGYNIGDDFRLYSSFDDYKKPFNLKIAGFINETGKLKYAMNLTTLEKFLEPYLNDLNLNINFDELLEKYKDEIPRLITVNDNVDTYIIKRRIEDNYDFNTEVKKYHNYDISFDQNMYQVNTKLHELLGEINDNEFIPNYDLYKKYNIKKDGYFYGYNSTSIILNDNLDILKFNFFSDESNTSNYSYISDTKVVDDLKKGIYLPKKYESIYKVGDKLELFINKRIYNLNITGFTKSDSNNIYTTLDYAEKCKISKRNFKTSHYVFFEDGFESQLDLFKEDITNNTLFNDYSITELTTFAKRLGIVNKVVDITKYIATVLASIIFILLVYNIGVIGLNNRVKDIAIYKAAGLKNSKLKTMFSLENILVVVIGSLLSILVCYFIANSVLTKIYKISAINISLFLNYKSIIIIILLAIVLMMISSFFINRKINKMNLASLMKGMN